MVSTKFYLDTRYGDKEFPIKISISYNGKTALLATGIKVAKGQWNGKEVIKHPNAMMLNATIGGMKSAVDYRILEMRESIKGKTATQIKDAVLVALHREEGKKVTFLSRFDRFLSLKNKKLTIQSYEWTRKKLLEFDRRLAKKTFEEIDTDYIKDFLASLDLSRNSKNILLRNIRAVFNDAIDANVTTAYPFRKISTATAPTKKKALTLEQMQTLFSCECEPWMEEYIDMFRLMIMLRGINAVDLFSAKLTQIDNNRLEYSRSKVGTSLLSVKIEPEAWKIIDKYRGKDYLLSPRDRYADYQDYLRHMNRALKSVGRPLGKFGKIEGDGLFPKLSSNWARHSWATVGIRLGIPKDVISRGMGHSPGVKVTDIYIDYDSKDIDDANRKIIDKIFS